MAIAQRLRVCRERKKAEDKGNRKKKIVHFEDEEEEKEGEEEGERKMTSAFERTAEIKRERLSLIANLILRQ